MFIKGFRSFKKDTVRLCMSKGYRAIYKPLKLKDEKKLDDAARFDTGVPLPSQTGLKSE